MGEDDDDMYYRIGGTAICAMLNLKVQEIEELLKDRQECNIYSNIYATSYEFKR